MTVNTNTSVTTTPSLRPGDGFLLRAGKKPGLFRVIAVDARDGSLFAYRLSLEKVVDALATSSNDHQSASVEKLVLSAAQPLELRISDIAGLRADQIQNIDFVKSKYAEKSFAQLDEEQKAKYTKIKTRISGSWSLILDNAALQLGNYWATIEECAKTYGVDRTTISRDMSRLYICGLDPHIATMMTMFSHGIKLKGPAVKRNVTKKLGRRKKRSKTGHDPEDVGSNVTDLAKTYLADFIKSVRDREGVKIPVLYNNYIDNFAVKVAHELADGTLVKERITELNMTQGQFAYHFKKLESALVRVVKQVGRKRFNLSQRIQIGHAKEGIPFPGHTYIIDSTVIDVYCVSAIDRKLLIGRPVVYVVIDAFSQMILSVHVALEGPDMEQAKIALYRAITDKTALLQNLGLKGCAGGHVQGVRPLFVYADRGELHSKEGRALAEIVQIAMSVAAPYRADWKALVERYFGIQNQEQVHWMPGAVRLRERQRDKERGDHDHRHDAVLTVNDLSRILLNLAAEWNLTHDMSKHVSCRMLRGKIDATPLAFWNYGVEELLGGTTTVERDVAIREFLPSLAAKADKRGIHLLENLRFTTPWMQRDDDYFEVLQKYKRLEVYLDPDAPRSAYVLNPLDNKLVHFQLVDTRQYDQQDLSIHDIRMLEEYIPLVKSDADKAHTVVSDTLRSERNSMIKSAAEKTAADKLNDPRSKTKQVSDIKENRKAEANSRLGFTSKGRSVPDNDSTGESDEDDETARWANLMPDAI